mgnify:CR=1 FL=1
MEDRGKIIIMAAAGLLLAGWVFYSLYSASRADWKEIEQVKPILEEAQKLALDYKTVLSGKDLYVGKYVLWCVQNRGEYEVFYKGDTNARLSISNYGRMPKFPGSKHSSCADMLLNIEDVRNNRSGAGFITAEFIYSRE